jgi:trigger factor
LWSDVVLIEATAIGHTLEPIAEPERAVKEKPEAAGAKKAPAKKFAKAEKAEAPAKRAPAQKAAAKKVTPETGATAKKPAAKSAKKKGK